MRLNQILNEKPVESSWITDLIYNRPNKVLTLRLSNGRSYSVPGCTRSMFERWVKSPSKGRFFHNFIRGKYNIERIK